MWRLLIIFAALVCFLSSANAQFSSQLSGACNIGNPGLCSPFSSISSGFIGPGDVVSGAYAWYSCTRGYNTADAANACNVCLPSDVTCADLTISSGFTVLPGSLSTCNITTVICTVKIMYDKTGNSLDVSQATEANRPTFRPAIASNGCPTTALPCVKFTAASSQNLQTAGNVTQGPPVTMSVVYIRGSANGDIVNNGIDAIADNGNFTLFVGSGASATAANGAWHAVQAVFNSASSAAYVDGVQTSPLNPGAGSAINAIKVGVAAISGSFDGSLGELGLWPSGFNATQAGNINANQHGPLGYSF